MRIIYTLVAYTLGVCALTLNPTGFILAGILIVLLVGFLRRAA